MSKVELNFKVIHSTLSHTLLGGEVQVTQQSPNSIVCQPECKNNDIHIILDQSVDKLFKELFKNAPGPDTVPSRSFTIYDQSGFINTKYSESRQNNNPGTIVNEVSPKALLSHIVLPIVEEGQMFIVLTSYTGFTSKVLDEQKLSLLTQDIQLFRAKHDLSKVILFIVEPLYKEITKFCDLNTIFKKVHVYTIQNIVPALVEYVAGSIVYGSKPDFQTFLSFGSNVKIVNEYFSPIKNQLSMNVRRGDKIHIATTSTFSSSNFMILLSHRSPDDIEIIESTNNTKYELVKSLEDPPIKTDRHLQIMIDSVIYLSQLEQLKTRDDFVEYMYSNSRNVVMYLIDSPILKVFKNDESLIDFDCMIYNYMQHIQYKIHDKLSNYPLVDYGSPPPSFYRRDMVPPPPPQPMMRQYTEAPRINK